MFENFQKQCAKLPGFYLQLLTTS